ncbi:MAG: PEP/pyruvate-binding domain-containing protein [Nanoarchaeota archaeon]|nr:PEP/pyruvate-binding domain-containing protein [Nanoarchaeota archaeon]
MDHIKRFKDLSKDDVAIAGGKGASLGEMTKAGISVPPGFVILSEAFERFLEETDLNVELDSILHKVNHNEIHTVENASEEIKALILREEMPQDLEKEILQEFKALNASFVAVRSSATSEDSSTAAWAGQLDSFLNTTQDSLIENVKHCWASLFTPRAIVYRFEKDLNKQKISVAVVVQKMVQSEVSGIAFSVHPVTQDYNQLIIEAGYGLGEAIVSGQITPDSYVVEKQPRRIIDINVSEQDRGLYKKSSGGNEWRDLGQKGKEQVLTEKQIFELSELILKIESHYGFPCDIEWAFEAGKFYIVQSRPITTLTDKEEVNKVPTNKKIILKELVHLDVPLSLVELHYEQETKENPPWAKEKFNIKPYIIYERRKDTVYFYFDISGTDWQRKQAGYFKEESRARNKIKEYYDKVKNILDNEKVLSKREFILFINNIRALWPWMNYMWWAIEYRELHGKSFDLLLKMRKYTENFTPGLIRVLRTSVRAMYPELKEGADFILLNEIEKNNIPNKETLKIRSEGYAYTCGKLYPSLKDIKEFEFEIEEDAIKENLSGQTAFPGKVNGIVRIINRRDDIKDFQKGEILVASTTTPDYLPAMKKAGAIISEHGGAICHAAITSRELKIPCVVGVRGATKLLQNGMEVEIDADKGIIFIQQQDFLAKVKQKEWIKNYEGKFSLFFNSLGLDLPHLREYLGVTLENALVLYKDGVATGNFVKSELDNFSKTLAGKAKKNPKFLVELSSGLKKSTDKIMKLLSQDPKVFLKKEKFLDLHKTFNEFSSFSMGVKETANALDYSLVEKYGKILEESRKYSEKVFFTISDVCGKMLEQVAKKEKISKEQAESFIVPEFEEYLKNGRLPSTGELSERYKSSVLLVMPDQKIILGNEAEEIDQELNKFEGSTIQGTTAYPGKVNGIVKVIKKFSPDSDIKEGYILVTGMTDPRFVPLMKKAKAIITDAGGMLCHAAIISRELKIPCIIGTRVATRVLKDGDEVEVDANTGIIKILNSPIKKEEKLKWIKEGELVYDEDKFLFLLDNLLLEPVFSKSRKRTGLNEAVVMYCDLSGKDQSLKIYTSQDDKRAEWGKDFFLNDKKFKGLLKEVEEVYKKAHIFREKIAKINLTKLSNRAIKEIFTKDVENLWHSKDIGYLTIDSHSWKIAQEMRDEISKKVPQEREEEVIGILTLQKERVALEEERYYWIKNGVLPYIKKGCKVIPVKYLDKHRQDYASYFSGFDMELQNYEHFVKLLKEDSQNPEKINKEYEELRNKGQIVMRKQNEIIKEYGISAQTAKKAEIIGKLAQLRIDLRVKCWSYYIYILIKILENISKKTGLSKRDMGLLTYNEFIEFLDNNQNLTVNLKERIKERKGKNILDISDEKGNPLPLLGEEAREYFENNIEHKIDASSMDEFKGEVSCKKGVIRGKVFKFIYGAKEYTERIAKFPEGAILVANLTMPALMPAIRRAKAIVTDAGGITSHAAIVSRELGIAGIIGTNIATKVLHDGDEIEVDTDKGIVKILKRVDSSHKADINPSNYTFLENVPGGYPLDVVYINLWALMAPELRKFGEDAGKMVIIFENGHYDLFIDKQKWPASGRRILDYTLQDDKKIKQWRERMAVWLPEIEKQNKRYSQMKLSPLTDKDLYNLLEETILFYKKVGINDAELVTPNYGTNFIHKELEDCLIELGYSPHEVISTILRSTKKVNFLEYEMEVGKIALACLKKKIKSLSKDILRKDTEIKEKVNATLDEYAWLDASITNPPKSLDNLIADVNALLVFEDKVPQLITDRQKESEKRAKEKELKVKEVLSKANLQQKRIINFAIESAETGRIIVDELMKFIYHVRPIYEELAKRLNVSPIELRFLHPKEIKAALLEKNTFPTNFIEARKDLSVCILGEGDYSIISGKEASALKNIFLAKVKNTDAPLKGEIAFSKGIVKGIARLVKNNKEMSKVQNGDILVSSRTYPDLLPAMKKSAAIIAELGGLLSHAAIVSRELHIPCLVGVKNAMSKIKEGDLLEIDTEKGTVKIIDKVR